MLRTASKTAKTRVTPYDVADHLRTREEMAAYLGAWLDEAADDAVGIAKAIGDITRATDVGQVAKGV